MTHQHTIIRLRALGAVIILGAIVSLALATEAAALTIDPDSQGIVAEESDKPSQAPAAPEPPLVEEGDIAIRIAPAPEEPFFPVPATTIPQRVPNIDPADFGVGWPAAVAVGVALLAVLVMALMWRRDEPAWVRSYDRH